MVRRYLAALLLLATPALAAVELDGDSNGAIDVAKGGTNATTAAGARTALGVQPLDSDLTSIAGLATTAWGRGLLDDADAAAGRTSLGIAPADTLNVAGVDLGTGSTTTGLLRFYGNTKAFSFGIFSQGADGLGVGWRLPSTIPAATSLLTVDSSGYMAYLDPSAVSVTASGFDGNLATTDNTLQKVAQKVDDLVISGTGDDLGSAAYGDVVALWTTCTGYLKSDGTCDTPSGSATYPSAAGVASWGGSAWGTSYTVGTAANNLVRLNGYAQLPAVSAALLTNFPTLNQNTTGTAGGLSGTPNITVGTISAGAGGFSVNADGGVTAKSVTVTRTTSPSAIDLYEGTGGGDNKLTLTLSGNLAADVTLNANQILATGDVDDTPVNGATTAPISSNWAYDHATAADPHTGYVLESAIGTTVQAYDADLTTAAGASAAASSTYFGKDSGGTVGFHAVPSGGGTPTTITVADTTDTTAFIAIFESATGDLGPKTDGGLTYNASTGMLTATGFTGPLTGTASGNLTASGTSTLTNKTLDTAATGNAITVPLNGVLDGAITDPADADDMIYAKAPNALTITDIHCLAEGGGTITLTLQECTAAGASCANIEGAITCDADGAEDDGTLTDGAIAAGAWIKVLYSAPTGTVNNVAWTVYGTQTW